MGLTQEIFSLNMNMYFSLSTFAFHASFRFFFPAIHSLLTPQRRNASSRDDIAKLRKKKKSVALLNHNTFDIIHAIRVTNNAWHG